jgi:hypothetical protein
MSLYVHAAGQKVNIIESKIAGLGFLQAIIARMANNSFYIKGWGTVAKLAMRQPFVLFKGLTFQKLCLPGAFRPGITIIKC